MNRKQEQQLNLIRAKHLQRRLRMDEDGKWITTEGGNHVHLNEQGVPDKGNPHVLKAMREGKSKGTVTIRESKGPRNGGKMVASVKTRGGVDLDLTDSPLEVSTTQFLPESLKYVKQGFETRHKGDRTESAKLVAKDGSSLGEFKGSESRTRIPAQIFAQADVLTHIHPRGSGEHLIGGTFSEADFEGFCHPVSHIQIMRAAAQEGIYTMKVDDKTFDRKAFLAEWKKREKGIKATHQDVYDSWESKKQEYDTKFTSGEIDYPEYSRLYDEATLAEELEFNKEEVERHNALLDMQKDFGFEYGLEEW